MGDSHTWTRMNQRSKHIPFSTWTPILIDTGRVLDYCGELGVPLGDQHGLSTPVLNEDLIAFNGRTHCGHLPGAEFVPPGSVQELKRHCGMNPNGPRCNYESFWFPRKKDPNIALDEKPNQPFVSFCKTGRRPYDLAVQMVLVVLKHYLDNSLDVSSDGWASEWVDPTRHCEALLGYGGEFFMSHSAGLCSGLEVRTCSLCPTATKVSVVMEKEDKTLLGVCENCFTQQNRERGLIPGDWTCSVVWCRHGWTGPPRRGDAPKVVLATAAPPPPARPDPFGQRRMLRTRLRRHLSDQ